MSEFTNEAGDEFLRRLRKRRPDIHNVGTFQAGAHAALKMLAEEFGDDFVRMVNCSYGFRDEGKNVGDASDEFFVSMGGW